MQSSEGHELYLPAGGSQQAKDILSKMLSKIPLRIVVIAATKAIGYMEARNLGIEPVAVVTPRTLSAARGVVADRTMDSASLTPEQREALMPHVLPCLATRQAGTVETVAVCPTCGAELGVSHASITIEHGLNGGHIVNDHF